MFEVGGFLAGLISEAELGAQSIIYELSVVAYMVTPLNVSPTIYYIYEYIHCKCYPSAYS